MANMNKFNFARYVRVCLCVLLMSFWCTNLGDCVSGDVHLLDGSESSNGRVEVCVNGQWFDVCDNGWTDEDAEVVCTQLGLPKAGE